MSKKQLYDVLNSLINEDVESAKASLSVYMDLKGKQLVNEIDIGGNYSQDDDSIEYAEQLLDKSWNLTLKFPNVTYVMHAPNSPHTKEGDSVTLYTIKTNEDGKPYVAYDHDCSLIDALSLLDHKIEPNDANASKGIKYVLSRKELYEPKMYEVLEHWENMRSKNNPVRLAPPYSEKLAFMNTQEADDAWLSLLNAKWLGKHPEYRPENRHKSLHIN